MNLSDTKGMTIVEIIVVIAVIVIALFGILELLNLNIKIGERARMEIRAIHFAEEAMEAVRNFRDNTDWDTDGIGILSTGVDYHPDSSLGKWQLVSGSELIASIYTRRIILDLVSRDANDDIEEVYNSANDDPNTRKITTKVSWQDRTGPKEISLVSYITNWREK